MAADYMRLHADEFCPFLGLEKGDPEFAVYCDKVASTTQSEWGGQLEVKALSAALQLPIEIYSADAPVVFMNDVVVATKDKDVSLKITFHKHYFALGEHYNSVMPLMGDSEPGMAALKIST